MNTSKLFTRMSTASLLLAITALPALAHEGHEEAAAGLPPVSAEVTLDYVTNYFFRGYEQGKSDSGITLQPGISLSMPVADDISATVGTWGSIQTEEPATGAATTNPGNWFEQDIYASIDASYGDFSAGVGLTFYTYPGGVGGDILEFNAYIGFDDSEYLGDFAFSPYVAVALEIQNNFVAAATENDYLEIGGAFSLDPLTEGTFAEAWTWEVPIVAGFSLNSYYADASGSDEFFGYASIGLAGSTPMSELIGMDDWFGAWDLNVGLSLLIFNGDVAGLTDNSSDVQVIGTVGISRTW